MQTDWISSIYDSFERLLRWAYPGMLFLVLLYVSKAKAINLLQKIEGYPWILALVVIVSGAVIYLFQINVITQTFAALAQSCRWDSVTHPKYTNKNAPHPKPRGFLQPLAEKWFNHQARDIEIKHKAGSNSSYLDYAWAVYHAASITGWLGLIFCRIKDTDSMLADINSWVVVVSALLVFFSLYMFARLTRVRE